MTSIKGRLPSKGVFCQRSSSIKGRLLSKVVFHQRSSSVKVVICQRLSSVKGCLLSKFVFRQRSSSIKGHPPSKFVSRQRSSPVKGRLLSKVVFHQWSSFVKGHVLSHKKWGWILPEIHWCCQIGDVYEANRQAGKPMFWWGIGSWFATKSGGVLNKLKMCKIRGEMDI